MMHKTKKREAFTLTETLVVIAILAILAALASWGVFAMVGTQQRRNTETTIRTLGKLVQVRWQEVQDFAKKETPSPAVVNLAKGYPYSAVDLDPSGKRARAIWIKVRLAEAFPVSYSELDPTNVNSIVNTYIPVGQRKSYWTAYQSKVVVFAAMPGESSALLLLALSTDLKGKQISLDDQLASSIRDTDTDGLNEFVDGWGRPLAFFRFPWNNALLMQANPDPNGKYNDKVDNEGMLINKAWYWFTPAAPNQLKAPRLIYETQFHSICPTPAVNVAPAASYYLAPVIVSAGRDGIMDLNAQMSPGANAADNIYSFQLRGE